MQVSTAPPYLTASLSIHKDKRPRDTLQNLREGSKVMLNVMPPTPRGASIVDETATPLPKGEDEGSLMPLETVDDQPLLLQEAVAAIEASFVEEQLFLMRWRPSWCFGWTPCGFRLQPRQQGLGRTVSARQGRHDPLAPRLDAARREALRAGLKVLPRQGQALLK